ncbi:MAG: hypothetical protein GW839_02035 [Flavobacteriales bacterium]|nr:hypothetical protein [Flavobacteriia bacterium]NCP04829.1 hypothetical protein [Flavobacteriales bacterium]PIV94272.1 MAG: hypothetical protein COW44_05000 [Flavobacteriaceae bacterium CG17_big_fil_post_rev_8_21_14_2_50_33_15]PIY11943.1 MAG: hypothetical protein COZ17_04965 [Flavobacteriaceae bacterium CG_4_10_14_3_um_filter_33_47]PJB16237.1 MAG: hypothetical protein CO117_15705 [Flavobacteriaceae bacterium CG_4_9_14_3_um_filter_33_16]
MLKILRVVLHLINVAIIVTLLAIHFVIKERSYWESIYFYMLPLPVIIAIVLILSVFLKQWKYNIILAGILTMIWLGRSFKIHIPEAVTENDLEIVFWNASRENQFEMSLKENGEIPDILVLVESSKNDLKSLQKRFPKYHFFKSNRELFIFSKTPLKVYSDDTSNYNSSVINFNTAGINFYAVDVTGSADVPRNWELTYVNQLIKKTNNTVVLGDFNVPFESKFLNPLKNNFYHAFNKKGNGFRETWFYNLPVLSLDHIWVSKDLKILKTQKLFTTKSDHGLLKTFIRK